MSDDSRPNVKVARVIDEYELDGLGAELERLWVGNGEESRSLRDLADLFNRRVLDAALRDADVQRDTGQTYEALTGDDVSEGVRTQVVRALEDRGVDADELTADFVSHQSIHTYLTEYRGAEKAEPSDEDVLERSESTVARLRGRLEAVTRNTLESLRDGDRLTLGDFDVLVDVRVFCADCGADYPVTDLFARGGCDCDD
ncbi:rod-determining factor RdfA [Halobaculum sp. P14]|uniref:rod-determining factor RdfA n=1 Tax=Halobaculum sp. P14 TaxID=3421638 RepID=UPI003EB8E6D9